MSTSLTSSYVDARQLKIMAVGFEDSLVCSHLSEFHHEHGLSEKVFAGERFVAHC